MLSSVTDERVHSLVKSRVFDKAANVVMRIGPNVRWNDTACWNDKKVLPNQIWTISQAILPTLHVSEAAIWMSD